MSLLYCLRYPNALQRRKEDGDKGVNLNEMKVKVILLLGEDGDEGEGEEHLQDVQHPSRRWRQFLEGCFDSVGELLVQQSFAQRRLLLLLWDDTQVTFQPTGFVLWVVLEDRRCRSDLYGELGAELSGQQVNGNIQPVEELTKVSLHGNVLPAPRSHDWWEEEKN